MKRDVVGVVAGVCLLLLAPAPAHALWGGGWLEKLSGPGPFRGQVFDARLLCVATEGASTRDRGDEAIGSRITYALGDRAWLTPAGCHRLKPDEKRVEFGVDFGFLGSQANVLDYTNRGVLGDDDTEVNVRTFMVTADLRVNRVLDVGAGIGRASFNPEREDLFEGFSRVVLQPIRVTTRPLAIFSERAWTEALLLRFDATKFNGRFTAEDFGARPGSFNEPGEITWSWSIRVDPFAFFW